MKIAMLLAIANTLLYGAVIETPLLQLPLEQEEFQELAPPLAPAIAQEFQLPTPAFEPSRKSPTLAATLSFLLPGFGHVYLGDMKTASGLLGSSCLTVGLASYSQANESLRSSSIITAQSIWSYGVYAAYRDARLSNGGVQYSYKMPTDTLTDLTFAPFKFSILKKPEVWGGFLGILGVAIGTSYLLYPKEAKIQHNLSSRLEHPAIALPVGIGEESLFRGYLQSQFSEWINPWSGIALSSLAFGAAHIPNAMMLEPEYRWRYYSFSLPFITGIGAYFGWITYKNRSLQESVALHTWYDFVIFAAASLATQSASTGRPGFALAVPF